MNFALQGRLGQWCMCMGRAEIDLDEAPEVLRRFLAHPKCVHMRIGFYPNWNEGMTVEMEGREGDVNAMINIVFPRSKPTQSGDQP